MPDVSLPLPFRELAQKRFHHEVKESDLAGQLSLLPAINTAIVQSLGAEAETLGQDQPRLAWELCRLVYKTARLQKGDPFICSMAALNMAKAAATWEQPQKLSSAIQLARKGFSRLNQPGWLAACDWVAASLPLAQNNLAAGEEALKQALNRLLEAGMENESFLCRFDLAWQQNILGKFAEAEKNLEQCEIYFSAQDQPLPLARCWRVRVRILTRSGQFEEAARQISKTRSAYEALNSTVGLAYLTRDEGNLLLYSTTDYERTSSALHLAASLFKKCDLNLSLGDVLTYLASLDLQVGLLDQAEKSISQAKRIFSKFHTIQPYSDCLTLQGLVYQEQGELEKAIENFQQAYANHQQNQYELTLSNDLFNLGNAHAKSGHYQLALQSLEVALELGKKATTASRSGLIELYLARVWLQLKNHTFALEHVDRAEELLSQTKQADSQVNIARLRARIYYELGDQDKALSCLNHALDVAGHNNIPTQTALTHRLLGEVFLSQQELAQAQDNFIRSLETFRQLAMQLEQANCLLSLARAAWLGQNLPQARDYCQQALDLSRGDYLEIEWRARAQLAELELQSGQDQHALALITEAAQYLSRIQRQFWQPAVAGTYAQEPAQMFASALTLATRLDQPEAALQFMEANKATTLVNQLGSSSNHSAGKTEKELSQLRSEINWMQNQMQVNLSGANMQTLLQMRSLRKELQVKSRRYEALISQLDRKTNAHSQPGHEQQFSLTAFREQANAQLGGNWLALDYHLVGDGLILTAVSADSITLYRRELSQRFNQALSACHQGAQQVTAADLEVLGSTLLPTPVLDSLTPETVLLISAHKGLHQIPWAAIGKDPLCQLAIPCLLPSLHAFSLLSARSTQRQSSRTSADPNGLLLGFSHFNGRHPDLPFVKEELAALTSLLGPEGVCYQDEAASQEILARIDPTAPKRGPELQHYAWMHVASHFFSDPASGYLSGVALTDQPLWLDQIRSLAPLPGLVSFSGCSSIFSRVYDGDEMIGLPSTCLLSGANTVIGSIWPVLDESSARLMSRFYRHVLAGSTPACALAYAQRECAQNGDEPSAWAGTLCLGLP